jgi:hypothetical protein
MEVHQHLHTPRKKWTHYLWEFLMLFLAVFCGFLAENQREHFVENKREKILIRSLLKDLEVDTANAYACLNDTIRIEKLDSLLGILYQPTIDKMDLRKGYYLNRRFVFSWTPMDFNRNTITQLKYGGNMRLIKNQTVVDSLNGLEILMISLDEQQQAVKDGMFYSEQLGNEIFSSAFFRVNGKFQRSDFILTSKIPPRFMTNDILLIQKYANSINTLRGRTINYHLQLKGYITINVDLIRLIRKEYHLK